MDRDIGQHVMLRLVDGRVIAPTEVQRRLMARTVLAAGRAFRLFGFRGADTHVHLGAVCGARDARELGRRVEISLGKRLALPVGFEPARVKPVRSQWHLSKLFDYLMRQQLRHGFDLDPMLTASNLPDLLGMRVLGGDTAVVLRKVLPRVGRVQLLGYIGQPDFDRVASALPSGVDDLADATAAAFALADLRGNGRDVVQARRAAAHAAVGLGSAATVGAALGIQKRAVLRLRTLPVELAAVRAVRMQLRWRAARRQRRSEAMAAGPP